MFSTIWLILKRMWIRTLVTLIHRRYGVKQIKALLLLLEFNENGKVISITADHTIILQHYILNIQFQSLRHFNIFLNSLKENASYHNAQISRGVLIPKSLIVADSFFSDTGFDFYSMKILCSSFLNELEALDQERKDEYDRFIIIIQDSLVEIIRFIYFI